MKGDEQEERKGDESEVNIKLYSQQLLGYSGFELANLVKSTPFKNQPGKFSETFISASGCK